MVDWRYVTPAYFSTLGIPIVRGRGFTAADRDPALYGVVLSEALAKRLFPDDEALGKHIRRGLEGPWATVIGIARDVKNDGLAKQSAPEYYELRKTVADRTFQNQEPPMGWRSAYVLVRTPIPPAIAAANLRAVLGSLDPTMPVETQTMAGRLGEVPGRPRFNALVIAVF